MKILTKFPGLEKDLPKALEDVPVVVEIVGEIRIEGITGRDAIYAPPGIAGSSGGNINECSAGTLGCVVTKNGKTYYLSNNHVLARSNRAAIGEDIVHPGLYDANCDPNNVTVVADLSEYKKVKCGFFSINFYDAAIAEIRSPIGCGTVCGYTPSSNPVDPALGMAVKKCGRTTGLTTGTVTSVNTAITVAGYSCGSARFLAQTMFTPMTQSGDSGSLYVTNDGNNNPVALNFAASYDNNGNVTASFGNPIKLVLQGLGGLTICSN